MYIQLSRKEQTAKKRHTCDGCFEKIEPGQRYLYEAGTYYGQFQTTKLCLPCNEALPAFWKYMLEHYGDDPEYEIGAIGSFRKGEPF